VRSQKKSLNAFDNNTTVTARLSLLIILIETCLRVMYAIRHGTDMPKKTNKFSLTSTLCVAVRIFRESTPHKLQLALLIVRVNDYYKTFDALCYSGQFLFNFLSSYTRPVCGDESLTRCSISFYYYYYYYFYRYYITLEHRSCGKYCVPPPVLFTA